MRLKFVQSISRMETLTPRSTVDQDVGLVNRSPVLIDAKGKSVYSPLIIAESLSNGLNMNSESFQISEEKRY